LGGFCVHGAGVKNLSFNAVEPQIKFKLEYGFYIGFFIHDPFCVVMFFNVAVSEAQFHL